MSETPILRRVLKAIGGRRDCRLFRNNVGVAIQGERIEEREGKLLLANPRRIRFGLAIGSSDLVGFRSIEITPDLVGKRVAVFLALETKTPRGKARGAQSNFLDLVRRFGGIAGIARDPDQAQSILKTWEPPIA